ncbi:MAG: PAS domain S-box protein [Desulfuromonadaceae bacterium]|nr:PAS domain S-box protein [Desulfuromonadaceae bacterium]MDD2855003.1 PAS domain S-box protein [Desulfuromonadaceae bacterium]
MEDKNIMHDELHFAEESADCSSGECPEWKLLIVDDEEEIHRVTRMAMQNFSFEGRGIQFISAYSGGEAKSIMQENPDTAVVLLDVVMESDDAGLDVVRHVRETLGNHFVRIILRTGRPGLAPERKVISEYDINDYREKTELTIQKLTTSIISALRSYKELYVIDNNRKEHVIRFHTVFHSSAMAMSIISPEGYILKVNPRYSVLTGYAEDEMRNLTIFDMTYPDDRLSTVKIYEDLLTGNAVYSEFEKRYLKKSGEEFWGHVTLSCVRDAQAKLLYFVSQMKDISRRKVDEAALKKANLELAAFAHTVAHDLRNPLTPIIVYSDIIKKSYNLQLDESGIRMLDMINSQAQKVSSMIDDLLLLAEKGQIASPTLPVESNCVAAEIMEELNQNIKEVGAEIIVHKLPAVRIPHNILSQLLGNLIGNAVKYSGKDGSPIEVIGERDGDRVRFIVSDHGVGIPVEERENIFKLYYRGTDHQHVHGSGVGLATVQKIAVMYGGNVRHEETPGGGCTFVVELSDKMSDKP